MNLYTYGYNNPLKFNDPTGHRNEEGAGSVDTSSSYNYSTDSSNNTSAAKKAADDNEKLYLNNLKKSGTSGQQAWAKKQLKINGWDVNTPSSPTNANQTQDITSKNIDQQGQALLANIHFKQNTHQNAQITEITKPTKQNQQLNNSYSTNYHQHHENIQENKKKVETGNKEFEKNHPTITKGLKTVGKIIDWPFKHTTVGRFIDRFSQAGADFIGAYHYSEDTRTTTGNGTADRIADKLGKVGGILAPIGGENAIANDVGLGLSKLKYIKLKYFSRSSKLINTSSKFRIKVDLQTFSNGTVKAVNKLPNFATKQMALDHFTKHSKGFIILRNKRGAIRKILQKDGGPDMPEFNKFSEYNTAAQQLFSKAVDNKNILQLTRSVDKATLRFDTKNGYFGIMSKSGVLKTFFRPDDGVKYFIDEAKRK